MPTARIRGLDIHYQVIGERGPWVTLTTGGRRRTAARMIPGAQLRQLPIADQDIALIPFGEWSPYEEEIARTFADFMKRAG